MELYLAPLEGITTYIYRNALEKYYGGIDKYYMPFLTAGHLKGKELREVHPDNNNGINLVPQILANDSETFVSITLQLSQLGYREVNLNLGCPSGTVTSKGRGAGFLGRPDELDRFLYNIYDELSKNVKLKNENTVNEGISISIKTRIGMESESEWEDILKIYEKYPVSELIIHPRLRSDFYSGQIRMDAYKMAREFTDGKIPLVYNGDITDIRSYQDKVKETGMESAGRVMIGRGVIMNPELPGNIKKYSSRTSAFDYDITEIDAPDRRRLKKFLNEISENYLEEMAGEKQVVMKMKELWSYLSVGLGIDKNKLKLIHKASKLSEYKSAVQMILY